MPRDVAAESLGDLGALAQSPTIARALDAVREFLDMEVAYPGSRRSGPSQRSR